MKKPNLTSGNWYTELPYYIKSDHGVPFLNDDFVASEVLSDADAKAIAQVPNMIDALIDLIESFEGGYEAKNTLDSIDNAKQVLTDAGCELQSN